MPSRGNSKTSNAETEQLAVQQTQTDTWWKRTLLRNPDCPCKCLPLCFISSLIPLLHFPVLKHSNPIIFPASVLSSEQAGHGEQSTHPDWHNSSLFSPAPQLETYFWMSQAHTHCFQTYTHPSDPRDPVLPPEHPKHNLKSLTLIHTGWQIGFWRRRVVKSRIDVGWKKDNNAQACLLFSLKSERTANQLHISVEPDHGPIPAARRKEDWNKTCTQYPL